MNPMDRVPTPPGPPPGVQFAPLPVNTQVQGVETPDGGMVVLVVTTPQGVNGFFLSADHARQLAQHLHQFATAAASGLQIIGDLGVPPTQNGTGQ